MATRYSGNIKIDMRWVEARDAKSRGCAHNGYYRATLSQPVGTHDPWNHPWKTRTLSICAPARLAHAVDSEKAYDDVAHAALSFANAEGLGIDAFAASAGTGWHISRNKATAWRVR
jgi:hypothetical protein